MLSTKNNNSPQPPNYLPLTSPTPSFYLFQFLKYFPSIFLQPPPSLLQINHNHTQTKPYNNPLYFYLQTNYQKLLSSILSLTLCQLDQYLHRQSYKQFIHPQKKKKKKKKMSNYSLQSRFKRIPLPQNDPNTNPTKLWQKKTLQIQLQNKQLRQTNVTLTSTPKNKKNLLSTDFAFIKYLGSGKFGCVYLAKYIYDKYRHIQTDFVFAMKVINKSQFRAQTLQETTKMINQFIRQIKIQMFLSHPNLIKLYSFFCDEYKIYLLMQLACDGQLYQYMKNGQQFSEESVSFLIRQTLFGINYMHEHHIIHRDIKPQNIVIVHGIPKFCDFGWSVYCKKQFRSTLCGTPLYLSPQILKGDGYNEKIDTWAIGTLAYQLLTGQNPFKITKKSQISKIVTDKFIMETGSSTSKDFLTSALQKNPDHRLTAKMMLEHPFIVKYMEIQTCEELCKKINQKIKQKSKNKAK